MCGHMITNERKHFCTGRLRAMKRPKHVLVILREQPQTLPYVLLILAVHLQPIGLFERTGADA